jgi:hypothetical protein
MIFKLFDTQVNSVPVLPKQIFSYQHFFTTRMKEIDSNMMRSPAKMDQISWNLARFNTF